MKTDKQNKDRETDAGGKNVTSLFTIISLAAITLITILMSVSSIVNLRINSYNNIDSHTRERINQITKSLEFRFQVWANLIRETAEKAAPIMGREPVDQEALRTLFRLITDLQTDAWHIYGCSNTNWTTPGGYLVFSNGTTPPAGWDNTTRNWFVGAKERPGEVAFATPYAAFAEPDAVLAALYTADTNGLLTTSVSTNVYDAAGNDVGVVSANIAIAFLSEMLTTNTSLQGEEFFFINKDGLYITHPDESAVLTRSFFSDFDLEQYRSAVLGSDTFTTIDKEHYLYSSRIPKADWILVTVAPLKAVYADTNQLIASLILFNAVLLFVAVAVAVFLLRMLRRDRDKIITANRLLMEERDEIAAMKDNLKTGVFLMDRDSVIQLNYSRSLETIFPLSSSKKKFIDILAASFTVHDLETVKDFFDMVRMRVRPQNQLEFINPLDEFTYTSTETRESKTLRCRFVPVERNDDTFLLGTVDDITEETMLKKQLEEEAAKRDEDMRSLFEVVHVEPTILMTFSEDATYNLDAGLALLHEARNDANPAIEAVLVRLYQLVHSVKSDAYIVGLNVYGDKLHRIESEIKCLRDRAAGAPALTPDVFPTFIARLEEMEEEKDKLFNILVQIHTATAQKLEEQDIIIASLKRACDRVSVDLGKQVRFETAQIDQEALKAAPYRQLKSILIQLVRNAVYHGIESPERREAAGKDKTGVIRFSLQQQNQPSAADGDASAKSGSTLLITIEDDGIGLNFEKIRSKALARGLIAETDAGADKLVEALFTPGFSTAETEGAHAGRGIGLNLVQDEVRALQGSIDVRTERGKGTAFIISIPLARA
jgi:two-component system chemotaxis sensor kinase CheA